MASHSSADHRTRHQPSHWVSSAGGSTWQIATAGLVLVLIGGSCSHGRTRRQLSTPTLALAEGQRRAQAGNLEGAIKAYNTAIRKDWTLLAAHRRLIQVSIEAGQGRSLQEHYQARSRTRPDDAPTLYALALLGYGLSTSSSEASIRYLDRASALAPDAADIVFRKGIIQLDAEAYPAAAESLARAHALAPAEVSYEVPLAMALHHTGKSEAALALLGKLLEAHPTARALAKAQEVVAAITDPFARIPKAARARIDQSIAWLERADIPQNAIDLLREVLQDFPDLGLPHRLLGLAYQRIGSSAEALIHFRKAAKLDPEAPQSQFYLGNFFYGRKNYAKAAAAYGMALKRNPLYLEAHQMLARIAVQSGDDTASIKELGAWALLQPKAVAPRIKLARALSRSASFSAAADSLHEVLRLEPSNLEAHLGLAALGVRRFKKAHGQQRKDIAKQTRQHLKPILRAQPTNKAALVLQSQLNESSEQP